ncbi:MAG: YIP1 family protein [Bacillota bacterium]|jgi:tetratricopeptide (TPR) repeat protein|nr:YIP1 family protein [Bacillota bacterium]
MQRRGWLIAVVLPAVIILSAIAFSGGASAALYRSYVYNFWGEPVTTPDPYLPVRTVSGTDLGAGEFKNAQYLFTAPDNTLYIVDTGNHRIIRTTSDFTLIEEIKEFELDGKIEKFNSPQSVYVTNDGRLFVADTQKERIVVFNPDGDLAFVIDSIKTDSPDALQEHFRFRPKRIAVDPVERLYVTVEGVFDGLMVLNLEGEFRGFMGAPRVYRPPWEIFWYQMASEEQRARMQLLLPTEFSAMALDEMGFIYTTVASSEVETTHYIRKLNAAGDDVLRRQGFFDPMGDLYEGTSSTIIGRSKLVDIIGREHGMYSALDQLRGRVFTYDGNGNLLYVFGGVGHGIGLFTSPSSLAELNGHLLVLDSRGANCITVFEPTAYANVIHNAVRYQYDGTFDIATEYWRQVMAMNPNYELAYSGVASAYMQLRDYKQAMQYYKLGNNRAGYSKAFQRLRLDFVNSHFGKIMTSVLGLIFLLYASKVRAWGPRLKQRYIRTGIAAWFARPQVQQNPVYAWLKRTWYALCYAKYVIFHPFDGFWDLKYENRGTVSAATILLVLTVLSYVFMSQYTGFVFNQQKIENINILVEAISIGIPVLLWCAVNWALTTLMDGKGTLKDIYIAAAYSLTPFLLAAVPMTIISNYITIEEGQLYSVVLSIVYVWTFALLFLGTGLIHDYSFGKILFTTAATIVGVGFACFVGLLFFDVLDRMLRFVQEVYREITLRL